MRYYDAVIEYSVNGGSTQFAQMIDAGGQMFTGVIPGGLVGVIDYTVSVTDLGGNTGLSSTLSFTIDATVNYCTAGFSAAGCQALLSTTGNASATAPSGFTINAAGSRARRTACTSSATTAARRTPGATARASSASCRRSSAPTS